MYKMEIITNEDKFDKFILFINSERDNLDKNDIVQYYTESLSSNNKKVINFLLKEYKYILGEDYIMNTLNILTDCIWKDMIKIFIDNNINIDSLYKHVLKVFLKKLNTYYTDEDVNNYLKYLMFILNNTIVIDLGVVRDTITECGYNKNIINYILNIVDIFILFGGNNLNEDMSEEYELLFYNRNKSISFIFNNLDSHIKDLLKDELDVETYRKCIEKFKKKNKIKFITKVKDDFYIMNDLNRHWVFDNDNIEYIKEHKKNPYTGEIISDDILKHI